MSAGHRNAGAALSVNMHLLYAVVFAGLAWLIWPARPEWWGLGVTSILFGLGAFACFAAATGAAVSAWRREKEMAAFMAQGGPPKSARLADHDALRRAGMIE